MAVNAEKGCMSKQKVLGSIIFVCFCIITFFFFTVGTKIDIVDENVIVEDLTPNAAPTPETTHIIEHINVDLDFIEKVDRKPSPTPYPFEPIYSTYPTSSKPAQDPAIIASEVQSPVFPEHATIIGMLVPIVSRGYTELEDFPFWKFLLPSSLRTSNWTFGEYFVEFYLGYDAGDQLFDNSHTLLLVIEKFQSVVEDYFLSLNQVSAERPHIQLIKAEFPEGYIQAPIWVLNVLAEKAYNDGCDYLFHLSDDVELVTPHWPGLLTAILQANNFIKNFGVTGPWDLQNHRIISQSFVHRSHMEIFGKLFPWAFKTWWADDWISTVYGADNYFPTDQVVMVNNLKTRFTVQSQDKKKLEPEIELAKISILEWLHKNHPSQVTQWSSEWKNPIEE